MTKLLTKSFAAGLIAVALGLAAQGVPAAHAADISVGVEIAPGAPPPPRREVIPVAPRGYNHWYPGRWRWDGGHWVWVGGHYVDRPHPGMHWVKGHWDHRPNGYLWVEGGWR